MKRAILLLLDFFVSISMAHANLFSIGLRVGGGASQIKVGQVLKEGTSNLNLKKDLGYHLGAFSRLCFPPFYIQPELLISGSGAKFTKENSSKEAQIRFTKVDFPIIVGLPLLGIVRVQVGPVFSLLLEAIEAGQKLEDVYSKLTVGWQGGLGLDIWNLVIDLKYEGNLSKFGDKIANIKTDHGYALWVLSVGINIF